MNRSEHPNENYARELMELCTLSIGHYREDDVKEAARAFTGWSLGIEGAGGMRPGGGRLLLRLAANHTAEPKPIAVGGRRSERKPAGGAPGIPESEHGEPERGWRQARLPAAHGAERPGQLGPDPRRRGALSHHRLLSDDRPARPQPQA